MITNTFDYSACNNEQKFKMLYIKNVLKKTDYIYVYPIETEETIRGFPDVMCLKEKQGYMLADFYEFKISDKSGKIKFQPTQPAFYKSSADLKVNVVALNKRSGKVHNFKVADLFDSNSVYKMNEKAEVNLNKGERNESTDNKP